MGKIKARQVGMVTIEMQEDDSMLERNGKTFDEVSSTLKEAINAGLKILIQEDLGNDGTVELEQKSVDVWIEEE